MATYHFDLRTISRGRGQSAVAAAAYRSGETLTSDIDGERKQPRRNRADILHAELVNWQGSREQLWNAAEKAENRKNSMLAREVIVALPHELTHSERVRIAREMAQEIADRLGVAADLAVHRPPRGEQNHHAHIMFTTRKSTGDALGKKTRELDVIQTGNVIVRDLRKSWETRVNQSLQGMSVAPVSCLPVRSRGEEPQRKLGPAIAGMMRRGIITDFEIRHTELAEAKAALAVAEAELATKIAAEKAAQDQANETANGHLQQRETHERHDAAGAAAKAKSRTAERDRDAQKQADRVGQYRDSIGRVNRAINDARSTDRALNHELGVNQPGVELAARISRIGDGIARICARCREAGVGLAELIRESRRTRAACRNRGGMTM